MKVDIGTSVGWFELSAGMAEVVSFDLILEVYIKQAIFILLHEAGMATS